MALSIDELREKVEELQASGLNTQQIADELSLSRTTVNWLSSTSTSAPESHPDDVRIGWRTLGVRPIRTEAVGVILADIVEEECPEVIDTVVGISLNGIIFAQSLANNLDCDIAIFRRADEDGRGHLSNKYGNVAGRRVAIVDDVLSSGATLRLAVDALKAAGADVQLLLVLVNKTEQNEIEGIPLRGLIRAVSI